MIQGSESFRLIVRRGPQPNQTYELNKDIITLGRDITNDIVINDPEVSRHHLRMTRGAGGFTVEDLGSTNGTFINGQRLTGARPLRNGDMVGLGETVTLGYEMLIAAAADPGAGAMPGNTMPGAAARGGMPAGVAPMSGAGVPMQQPPQAAPSPYSPQGVSSPQVGGVPQGTAAPGQPPQQGYGYNYTPASSYSPAPSPYAPAGAPGAVVGDYDPYAVRDEEPRSTTRWILIGCAAISLFCCCSSVLGLVAVDQLCLWDRIPILYDVLRAFGYTAVC